jgi:hypothetical protein
LLAKATVLPLFRALTVEERPAKPTIPLRTTSAGTEASVAAAPGPVTFSPSMTPSVTASLLSRAM